MALPHVREWEGIRVMTDVIIASASNLSRKIGQLNDMLRSPTSSTLVITFISDRV